MLKSVTGISYTYFVDDMAFRLFPLADEYKMGQLKEKCESCIREELKKRTSDCSFLLRCLVMADKFALTTLWEETLQLCCPIAMESWRACPEMQNVPLSTQSILKIIDKQRSALKNMETNIVELKSDLKTTQVELEQSKAQNRYLQQAPRSRSGFM